MKKEREAAAYLLAPCVAAGIVITFRLDWMLVASMAKYLICAWIIVRCRPLYVSLPLSILIFSAVSIAPPILRDYGRGEGVPTFQQVTSFPVYSQLILAALYCCFCYVAASVFYAIWSRQDRAGHLRTLITLVSGVQLLLAIGGIFVVVGCRHTIVFTYSLMGLFGFLGLGAIQGFLLGKNPAIRTMFMIFNWLQAAIWLLYLCFVERFAAMTPAGGRWRGGGDILLAYGIPILAVCLVNGILVGLVPHGRPQRQSTECVPEGPTVS